TALAGFKGVSRRFQRYGEVSIAGGGEYTLVDDYGHHPAEMAAAIAAARGAFPGRRLVLAFQPHRYTRTRDLFEDFVRVLSTVDVLLLGEVYPAGEVPIVAADGRALARAIRVAGKVEPVFVEDISDMAQAIRDLVRPGDVVLSMGAGSIGTVGPALRGAGKGLPRDEAHGGATLPQDGGALRRALGGARDLAALGLDGAGGAQSCRRRGIPLRSRRASARGPAPRRLRCRVHRPAREVGRGRHGAG